MAELYEIHAPRLLRLLSRFMPDRALADDALQETFITAFQSLSRLRGVENLQAWLARIAVREKCGRLDWQVLEWNTPAVDFYRSLGARMLTEWETFRLAGDALERLARDG